ncbi:hypothetical protein IQ07DRAFT_504823 [Pyrenochaeta sp. DS3sAY3a]|nr:hypothetical protein IQ07DRAFT_504823 [Pyrenochaeta sp. DS3sAY3a]
MAQVIETGKANTKRLRTSGAADGAESDEQKCNSTRSRSGLLTPEPSTLTESQAVPSAVTESQAILSKADEKPSQIFPFMQLPAELRIHIYHMALHRDEPLFLHVNRVLEKPAGDTFTSPFQGNLDPQEPTPTQDEPLEASAVPLVMPAARSRTVRLPTAWGIDAEEHYRIKDPIVPEILRLNKLIYKEARQVLYSDNIFTLSLVSGIHTLSTLHQRSRSLIKHVVLTIPSHHDILDGFADLVRLGLRYCWGLKSFKIILQASLPDDGGRVSGTTSVYANAFHILRWLPRGCSVALEGRVSESVMKVVKEEGRLMSVLDETSYLKRQHQMPERH